MTTFQNDTTELKNSESDILDFSQYIFTVKRYFWRISSLSIFLTTLVLLFVLTITPQYTSKVSLLIEAEQANVLSIEEVYGLDSSRKEYFETQYEILRSKHIARKVVESLGLQNNTSFDQTVHEQNKSFIWKTIDNIKETTRDILTFLPQKPMATLSAEELELKKIQYATNLLVSRTSILPVKNTQVVEIYIESPDAKLSAEIANTFADVYIENYLESKFEMTEKATTWLNESLQGLRTKLDEAEKKLSDFYEREQVVDIDGVVGLASEEVQQLSEQLIDSQIVLQRNRSIFEQVSKTDTTLGELSTIPEVMNHPSIQSVKRELVLAESRISELREVYGPKHPRMVSAQAELNSIIGSQNNQISNLVSGIESEFNSIKVKVKSIEDDLQDAKARFRSLAALDNQRKALQRDVDINQQLYDSFFTRLKETDQLGGFESANARVLDMAIPSTRPSKPKKGAMVVLAFILSFGFGVVLAISLEALNSGVRSMDDVERKLSQRLIGVVPWQPHSKKENLPLRHFFDSNHHVFSESIRTLRTSIQLLNIDKPAKTILVTSSVPKEGKSTVSINLAFALGQLNKVVLVDADLRRPTIAKRFELPGFQPGLANAVAGTHELSECIVHDELSNIDIICAGTLPPNPQELLASDKFSMLMESLTKTYDHVIVDSAPTQAVSDAIVVSKHCDSVVYVVKADSTNVKAISNGLSRFLQIGHRIDGVVLNQIDLKKANKGGDYSGFYDQYGYNSTQEETIKNT